jgi:carbonic anhydrase/acetyltransferase-like protein (isoleucine patch superfamily)
MPIVRAFAGREPQLGADVWIADNATVIGQVVLGDRVNVWYGAVLRADVGHIHVGADTNIQDLACLHMSTGLSNTDVGEQVTVGHGATIHGARIGDGALIGMGAIILDNAEIGEGSLVAAGSVVTPRTIIPARSLVIGSPAKVVRPLRDEELDQGRLSAMHYVELAREHGRG